MPPTNSFDLVFNIERQDEGGYVLTSPTFPELLTEADTLPQLVNRLRGSLLKVLEYYAASNKDLPQSIPLEEQDRQELGAMAATTNHHMWENPTGTGAVSIPDLGSQDLRPRVIALVAEKLGLDPKEF